MPLTTYLKLEPEVLSEHQEQTDLMNRILDNITTYPELAAVFAVPNGGYRNGKVAMQMLQEGVKAGVPDLILSIARGGYHGYYQEQKRTKDSTVTPKQKAWHRYLKAQGYKVDVCKGCEAGWQGFLDYLALPPTPCVMAACLTRKEQLQLLHDLLPDWAALAKATLKARIGD